MKTYNDKYFVPQPDFELKKINTSGENKMSILPEMTSHRCLTVPCRFPLTKRTNKSSKYKDKVRLFLQSAFTNEMETLLKDLGMCKHLTVIAKNL